MNKVYGQTLLDDMVRQQSLPMPLVKQAAREILAIIREGLIRDGVVNVSNFGTFRLKSVAARQGINPQTRETITIPAHQRVIFSPCKALRELIQPVRTPPVPIQPSITTKSSDKSMTRVAVSSSAKERIQPDELPPTVAATTKEVVTPTPLDSTSRSDFLTPLSSDEATEKPACAQRELAETDASHTEPVMEPNNEIAAIQTPVPPENSDCAESVNISLELSEDKKAETEDCNISKNRPYYLGAAAVLVITLVSAILLTDSTPNIENEETGLITAAPELKSPASDLNPGESHPNAAVIMVNTNGAGLSEKSDRSNNNQEVNENTAASATIPPGVTQASKQYFTEQTHEIAHGESLWRLARSHYRDPLLWPHIYQANTSTIGDPDHLLEGSTIIIPGLQGAPDALSKTDRHSIAEGYYLTYLHYKKTGRKEAFFALLEAKRYDSNVVEQHRKLLQLTKVEEILLTHQETMPF